jgi:hypothetical protein
MGVIHNARAIGIAETRDSGVGHVRVYTLVNNDWRQLGPDIDGKAIGDYFGASISLSNDGRTIAIGAALLPEVLNDPYDVGNFVEVYQFVGNSWVLMGDRIAGEAPWDRSGTSVSLSSDGRTVAAGAPFNQGNGDEAGQVRIHTLVNN